MKKNIHALDRSARLLFAAVVAFLYVTGVVSGAIAAVLGVAAVILAATAVISFCPIYHLLGISTKKSCVK